MAKIIINVIFFNLIIPFYSICQYVKINPKNRLESKYSIDKLIKKKFISPNSCIDISNIKHYQNPGVSISKDRKSWGYFFNEGNNKFAFKEGILISTGHSIEIGGPNKHSKLSRGYSKIWKGDKDMYDISKSKNHNSSIIEFDFISHIGGEISFRYIFASEEYNTTFECSTGYSDIFVFLISGPGIKNDIGFKFKNLAVIPKSNQIINTYNVNNFEGLDNLGKPIKIKCSRNSKYYISNGTPFPPIGIKIFNQDYKTLASTSPIEFNGMTIALEARSKVIAGKKYHLKLAVADLKDPHYDSGVFLESKSLKGYSIKLDKTEYKICNDQKVTIKVKNPIPNLIYTWSDGTIGTSLTTNKEGEYVVKARNNANTCEIKSERVYIINKVSDIGIDDKIRLCETEKSYIVDANVKGSGYKYRWSDGSTGSSMKVTKSGKYWIEVSKDGCVARKNFNVEFEKKPDFKNIKDIYVCFDKLGKIPPVSVESGFDDYLWSTGEKGSSININKTGTYWVQVKKGVCYTRDTFKLTLNLGPKIDIKTGANKIIINPSGGIPPYSFSIDGGKVYKNTGIFDNLDIGKYKITVKDKVGCVSTTNFVDVIDIVFPKFFSPNGDGINDIWKIDGILKYKDADITIFDRYGKLVFRYIPTGNGWDGTYNNTIAKQDDYWYVFKLKNGKIFKGNFSLIR